MNILNFCIIGKDKYCIFLNVLKSENILCMSKYKYEYNKNVELSIYHPINQNFCLIL